MSAPPTEPTTNEPPPNEHWLDMMMRGEGAPPEHARSLKFDTTLKLTRWEEGAAFCDWTLLKEHCSPMGFAFGGYVGCVVDQAAVFAMSSIEGGFHLTQDMRLTYFRPMAPGDFKVEARIVNRSRTAAFVEVLVLTPEGKLCCKAALMNMLRERGDFTAIPQG